MADPTQVSLALAPPHASASLHLMPCSIGRDGPAPISTYFLARPSEASDATSKDPAALKLQSRQHEAAFRGRRLHGVEMDLPAGYTGVLLSAPTLQRGSPASTSELSQAPPTTTRRSAVSNVSRRGSAARGRGRGRGAAARSSGRRTSPRKAAQSAGAKPKFFSLDGDDSDEERERKDAEAADRQEVVVEPPPEKMEVEVDDAIRAIWDGGEQETSSANLEAEAIALTRTAASSLASVAPSSAVSDANTLLESRSASTIITEPSSSSAVLPPFTRSGKVLSSVATFDSITFWNPDLPPTEEDAHARAIQQWIGLSALIHTY